MYQFDFNFRQNYFSSNGNGTAKRIKGFGTLSISTTYEWIEKHLSKVKLYPPDTYDQFDKPNTVIVSSSSAHMRYRVLENRTNRAEIELTAERIFSSCEDKGIPFSLFRGINVVLNAPLIENVGIVDTVMKFDTPINELLDKYIKADPVPSTT